MTTSSRPLKAFLTVVAAAAAVLSTSATAEQQATAQAPQMAELWAEPKVERDLFYGPGGRRLSPDPGVKYEIIAIKLGGFSDGYTLKDSSNRQWSAKFPPEAHTEVVASRIYWGIGFHQPPIYFLREWQADTPTAPNPQLPARFREKEPDFHGLTEEDIWSFYENPFVGTRQLAGLLVLQAMLGNSDLKDANNALYSLKEPVDGVRRWYTVLDIGHTFGRTGVLDAPRGDIAIFEQTPFIRQVQGSHVELEYGGRHKKLFENITTADVRWICERLTKLTDKQWRDAFRAAGYEPGLALRFINRMKQKITEGLSLPA